jgi:hypothetical protein
MNPLDLFSVCIAQNLSKILENKGQEAAKAKTGRVSTRLSTVCLERVSSKFNHRLTKSAWCWQRSAVVPNLFSFKGAFHVDD